ncbi:hypothetical protein SAMN02745146_2604 [Hymenobacter daecheongensis DSM 21074]|uniref:TonB protein C-terminal n=1 Tax=Hymenobacter daecheongensis DSM 21074 TaxID=1121955 RepID=A0A1M6HRI3_9BACT|nr:hypothetical protein [Hymenobacter daecheongensis]SHJ24714.1 hypothetical protein SAMN02745146_2604 [Hymenobacter daecheongensis DSM 21074]
MLTPFYKVTLLAGWLLSLLPHRGQAQARGIWAKADIPLVYNRQYEVGNILFDPSQDRPDFALRPNGRIYQYYNFDTTFPGGRVELRKHLLRALPTAAGSSDSGFLTVRFVVNYRGETDRFRVQALNSEYQPQAMDPELVARVLGACRALRGWLPGQIDGETKDSYFYITFVVREGHIQDITL